MAMLKLMETSIPELYSRGLYDEKSFDLAAVHVDKIATIMFVATSECLKGVKSKDYPVAFVFEGANTEFYAGAIVRFIPSEEANMPGHWNYVWTFDANDIPDNARRIRLKDAELHTYFRTVGAQHKIGFHDANSLIELGNFLMLQISKWLQENAKVDEEVGVILDGIFQARAIVEDNEVVKSIEVIGETKAIIKDDAGNEV